MITADRVMKARRGGRCSLCPAAVTVGQQIGRIAAGTWAHTVCIIATRSAELAELRGLMIQPPRPSERDGQDDDPEGN